MARLIAFTGKAGVGKSSAALGYTQSHRFIEGSFAERPKKFIMDLFGIERENLFGTYEQKNAVIPHLSKERPVTGRYLLQTFMTDWGQDTICKDIWVDPVARRWENMKNVPGFAGMVISDLRFDSQAEWVKSQGGVIIKIVDVGGVIHDSGCHSSEAGISDRHVDAIVVNPFVSINQLFEDVENAVKAIEISSLDRDYSSEEPNRHKDLTDLIVGWANRVFPNRTIANALQKMVMHEIPEYLMKQDDEMELADLGILIYDIAHLAGYDLEEAIRKKMAINEKRLWAIDSATGLMSHIKTMEPSTIQSQGDNNES